MAGQGSNLYGALGDYERSIRERKFKIAEKEDMIANLKAAVKLENLKTPQLEQKCELLKLKLKVEEARYQTEFQSKLKLDAEHACLVAEHEEQLDALGAANVRLAKVREFQQSRKLKLQALEEDHMQKYKKMPVLSELIHATEKLQRLEVTSREKTEILEEKQGILAQMQQESQGEWKKFVGDCVEFAESSLMTHSLEKDCKVLELKKLEKVQQKKKQTASTSLQRKQCGGDSSSIKRSSTETAMQPSASTTRVHAIVHRDVAPANIVQTIVHHQDVAPANTVQTIVHQDVVPENAVQTIVHEDVVFKVPLPPKDPQPMEYASNLPFSTDDEASGTPIGNCSVESSQSKNNDTGFFNKTAFTSLQRKQSVGDSSSFKRSSIEIAMQPSAPAKTVVDQNVVFHVPLPPKDSQPMEYASTLPFSTDDEASGIGTPIGNCSVESSQSDNGDTGFFNFLNDGSAVAESDQSSFSFNFMSSPKSNSSQTSTTSDFFMF